MDNKKINALMLKAINNEDLNKIKELISHGANINSQFIKDENFEEEKINTLLLAIEFESIHAAIYLIENGADIHADNEEALCWSIRKGYIELIEVLIKNGANLFVKKKDSYVWMTNQKHMKAIEYLISLGIDIEKTFICENVIGKAKLLINKYIETKKLKENLEIKLLEKNTKKIKKNKV